MKTFKFLFPCISLVLLLACSDSDREHAAKNNEAAVLFRPVIGRQLTRTINGGDEWEAGDQAGIYMKLPGSSLANALCKNYRHVVSPGAYAGQYLLIAGNRADSSIYFPVPPSPVDFVAYYPYNQGISGGVFPVDISSQHNQEALDVLYASKSISSHDALQPVELPFSHKMAKLRLEINRGEGVGGSLAGVQVRIDGIPATADLNLDGGLLTANGAPASITPKNMGVPAGQENDSAAFQCIIIPHGGDTFDERKVIIAAGGKIYIWNIPDRTSFEENKIYTYHLSLTGSKVVDISGNIKPWEDEAGEWAEAGEGALHETGELNMVVIADGSLMPAIYIRAGSFWMGSPAGEPERVDSCEGRHGVNIANDFLLGKFEVTNAQFASFLNEKGIKDDGVGNDGLTWITGNPAYGLAYSGNSWGAVNGKDSYPVSGVSWYGAKAFTVWAGNGCRLPTEAEWEYACRAGTQTSFFFGADSTGIDKYVWYRYSSNGMPESVGKKDPNKWDLHDMCGNVFEWCLDCFAVDYSNSPAGAPRILRGGSYRSTRKANRSAYRFHTAPESCNLEIGFRVAFDAPGI